MQGQVKNYWPEKGYGFVEDDETGQAYFFHRSDLLPDLSPPEKHQLVSFEVAPNKRRGPNEVKAIRLRPLTISDVLGGR